MEISTDLQNLIDEYIKRIEDKEDDLALFSQNIEKIISDAKKELDTLTHDLDSKFDANSLEEQEYLNLLRKGKEEILEKAKGKLDSLVNNLESQ